MALLPATAERGLALVTGGARGIGAACCRRLARDGYAVVINYRHSSAVAEALAAEIVEAGGKAATIQADVSTEQGVSSLFNGLDRLDLPALTALVNNAGVIGPKGCDLDALLVENMNEVFNTNVLGPLLCCREAEKRMPRGSVIINISSGSAYIGTPLLYAMSKGALNSMQHGLIKPLAAKGIRINTVSPGMTDTDMISEVVAGGFDAEANIPLGRIGTPDEIAGAVSYLASLDASYVSGANIRVAGGRGPGTTLG